jgi:Pyruvate:ferredoxin oxidoreductase and related 2-oxoacid:ferredoxin oxidoreductases, gamma subunit
MKNGISYMDVTIRISGAQGEGVESAGRLVALSLARLGYHVFAFRQYASIIKGNPAMFYQIRGLRQEDIQPRQLELLRRPRGAQQKRPGGLRGEGQVRHLRHGG